MTSPTIYFVAGEASGDNHGAALMRSLRQMNPEIQFTGRGGPQMKSVAGEKFQDWIADAAVLGLWEVVKSYGYFRRQFGLAISEIENSKPDAVVLIDYPGFNLRLARALRGRRTGGKLIYYISPQVWAWHRGRITKMARWIDLMLCIFPFEADLYNRSGLRTRFVGHPMLERLEQLRITARRDPDLVALFPGSRRREVRKIFPVLLEVAAQLRQIKPGLRFEVAAASSDLAGEIQNAIAVAGERGGPAREFITVTTNDAAGLMQRATAGVVASGSATLEAAFFRMPFVLVYKVSWLTYLAARMIVTIKHLGMPNVLAGREIVPEFIQHRARPLDMARALLPLLEDSPPRAAMIAAFDQIAESLGKTGASETAAAAIMEEIRRE